jgi:hypothetical protein
MIVCDKMIVCDGCKKEDLQDWVTVYRGEDGEFCISCAFKRFPGLFNEVK